MISQNAIDYVGDILLPNLAGEVLTENKFSYPYSSDLEVVDYYEDDVTERMPLDRFVFELYYKIVEELMEYE